MLPKITVVTPSFNQGAYLEETIVSVLSQNYPNLEYILIDGGSTDQSIDIIHKYKSAFTYWISEKDNGQSEALNRGFRRATGEILTWLNSDDVYVPGTLAHVAGYFEKNPGTSLMHGRTIIFGNGMKDTPRGAPEKDLESLYLAYIPFPQPSSFFRHSVLKEQGYLDQSLHYGMDFDLLARIALNYKIDRSDTVFSRYRMHETSKSNNALGFAGDWNIVFSRILRSLPGTGKKIEQLNRMHLYVPGEDRYHVSKIPGDHVLDTAFYHFLKGQAQMYYIAGNPKKSYMLFTAIKKQRPDLFRQEKLSGLHMRSFLLNPFLLKFFRSLKA